MSELISSPDLVWVKLLYNLNLVSKIVQWSKFYGYLQKEKNVPPVTFYERLSNGQFKSGNAMMFVPAHMVSIASFILFKLCFYTAAKQ